VQAKVRSDAITEKATEVAKTRAAAIAAELKTASDFAAAVKRAGLAVKTSELVARGAALPDVGISADIDKIAFAMKPGQVSDPISTPQATAIVRVAERQDVTDEQIAAGREQLREELVNQRRDRFFSAFMQKAKQGLKIDIRQDVLARVST
jgi:hypothetical protein